MITKAIQSTVKTFKHQSLQILEKYTNQVNNAMVQREEQVRVLILQWFYKEKQRVPIEDTL